MPAAWLDDGFHSHGKRELVDVACDGLLARAISRSAAQQSDGFVEGSWVCKQLKPRERKRVLDLCVRHRLLEPLGAGETRTVRGRPRPGLRSEEVTVTVGPFEVDGYLVHDFLDCNRARCETLARRAIDARKKREQREKGRQDPLPWETGGVVPGGQSDLSPDPSPSESLVKDSRYRVGEQQQGFEADRVDARAPRPDRATVTGRKVADVLDVLDVLEQAPRLHVDRVGVENAIAAFPAADAVQAARRVVTLGTDPAYRLTNAATLMWKALDEQRPPAAGSTAGADLGKYDRAMGLA